eukprot:362825-Chlamydomonas_euryale.AAC.2
MNFFARPPRGGTWPASAGYQRTRGPRRHARDGRHISRRRVVTGVSQRNVLELAQSCCEHPSRDRAHSWARPPSTGPPALGPPMGQHPTFIARMHL